MSSVPMLLHLIDELDRPSAHDFGLGLHPHHIHHHRDPALNAVGYNMPMLLSRLGDRQLTRRGDKGEGKLCTIGKDGFQVCMDVTQYKPSELVVKVVDKCVIVEGKHEEREDDHGYISRHFIRRYTLPKGYNADRVMSTLSSDGVLTVSVPNPALEEKSNERIVQIQQVGPAHLNVKKNTLDAKAIEGSTSGANGDNAEK